MKIHVIRPEELSPQQIQCWSGMMSPKDVTDGPFFHPDYVIALGRFREPVRVAVITEHGREVAFFPFEQNGKTGHPLGIKLCDFQGIIRAPETKLDIRGLLAGCGLTSWHFDHVVASQPEFRGWHLRVEDSVYIDLARGFDAYITEQKRAGIGSVSQTYRLRRKLEREVGPLRFVWHSTDRAVFETLLEWKSEQRKQTGTFNVMQFEWVTQALDAIRQIGSEDFGGVLSALYVNDTLIAAALCMRTKTVLHKWFSTYQVDLRKYSPGHLLSLAMIEEAATRGIERIDLGRGEEVYKRIWSSGSIPVGEGAVDLNAIRHLSRTGWYRACHTIRNSRLREPIQIPKRMIRYFVRKKKMGQT